MTTATGIGPLPELLEQQESRKAVRKVFAAEGVPLSVIRDRQHRVPLSALAGIFHRAAVLAGDWRLGLDVGEKMPLAEYGLWATYAMQAVTLGDALARAVQTLHVHQTGTVMRLVPRPHGLVAWEYEHPAISAALFREHTDHIVPGLLRFLRGFLGPEWTPLGIEVGYPAPPHARELESATETQWQFNSPRLAVLLPASALLAKKPQAPELPGCAPTLCYDDVVSGHTDETTYGPVADVASVIRLRLLDGNSDIEGAARLLASGSRKLQRRLEQEGLTYRTLLTDIRMRRARSLIEGTETSLKRIGLELGYADPAHFTRAFGSYWGFAPSSLRRIPAAD